MGAITRDYTYPDGKCARPNHANANEVKLFNEINGSLDWENLKAALVNAANGILKLDGNARVLLAQIPDTLTGKDADTIDTLHASSTGEAGKLIRADEVDSKITTHENDASAHHTKTTDHGSLGGLSDDDHAQYYNAARHTKAIHDSLALDHGSLSGKGDDDHSQYYNSARHTKALHDALDIDAGTLEESTKTQVRNHTPKSHALSAHTAATVDLNMGTKRIRYLFATPEYDDEAVRKDYVDAQRPPDYDSNWTNINQGEDKLFTHNLGTTNLLVDVQGKHTTRNFME